MIVARVDVGKKKVEFEESKSTGPIDEGLRIHHHTRSFSKRIYDPANALVFGMGPLADLGLPGTHRLTFAFRSPLSGGFYISTMGGAGWHLKRTGVHAVSMEGKADNPTLVSIKGTPSGEPEVQLFEITPKKLVDLWENGGARRVTLDLVKCLDYPFRSVLVGPASLKTPMGIIYSADLQNGQIRPGSEDVAGKGGAGSVLLRAHNVVGVAFGGKPPKYQVKPKAQKIVEKVHKSGKNFQQIFKETTEKYSYSEKMKTGGTFGSNYPQLQIYTPLFNFGMIHMSKSERELKWKELMGPTWWEKFNSQTIVPKKFATCGEPCPVACKKVFEGVKVDYEPFEACGPNSWIFDIDQAAKLVSFVDTLGYDAIEFGTTLSWMLEAMRYGHIPQEALGFDGDWSYSGLARFGMKLAENLALEESETLAALRQGKREGGLLLDDIFGTGGTSIRDLTYYVPYGKRGYMTPTMYWAIGNFVPLPLQGRYWTQYKFAVWFEPEDLAKRAYGRAVAEAELDNLGICRFHRGWLEPAIKALAEAYGVELNGKKLIQDITRYNRGAGAEPTFWDTQRTKDIITIGAKEFGGEAWARKFSASEEAGLDEYWNTFSTTLKSLV
ncbi:MAG TPA: glyceraldehyde-3-phosphate:ferredoxin oxidoreductase [archaeon]|nr:glyceraldehyde-3-phosphate:ferredoxin oxidoreductase [archaeon]